MSTPDEMHTPRPEFVHGLEAALLKAYHEVEAPIAAITPHTRWREWSRIAAVLVLGAALGVGGQIASAQVKDARTRSELERTLQVERELAALRLDLVNKEAKRVAAAYAAGALAKQLLRDVESERRATEVALQRIDLDLAEVGRSSVPPRNELWAPVVGERDFVKERLQLEAESARARIYAAESQLAELERGSQVGATSLGALLDAQQRVVEFQRDFGIVASQLHLRDKYLTERLEPAELSRLQQQNAMLIEMRRATQLASMAKGRLAAAEQAYKAGTITELDLKRAQLEALERETNVRRMQVEMQRVGGKEEL